MHKIAIVIARDNFYNYGDDYDRLIESISEWTEVDDETFALLKKAEMSRRYDFGVLEQPVHPRVFIKNTVEDYVAHVKAEEEKREAEKKKKAEAARKRKLNKMAKDEAAKRILFNQLKEELGE